MAEISRPIKKRPTVAERFAVVHYIRERAQKSVTKIKDFTADFITELQDSSCTFLQINSPKLRILEAYHSQSFRRNTSCGIPEIQHLCYLQPALLCS
jgi:hypothetical protein